MYVYYDSLQLWNVIKGLLLILLYLYKYSYFCIIYGKYSIPIEALTSIYLKIPKRIKGDIV